MKGFRPKMMFMGIGAAVGSILAGVLSHGSHALHFMGPTEKPKPRKRPANHRKFRRRDTFCYEANTDPNSREAQRRQRQIAAGSLRLENGLVP